ncbi:MAG: tetratricopeptide repeat protein [Planctomycetota bacterium]
MTAKLRSHQKHTYYNRDMTTERGNSRQTCQVKGYFYLPEERTLELKFIQEPSKSKQFQRYSFLFIDQRKVLGGANTPVKLSETVQLKLPKGGHAYELLVTDFARDSHAIVGYRQTDGTFAPLPPEWFSALKYPELEEYLKPKARIKLTGNAFNASFRMPKRLRKLRWVFEDYEGNLLSADAMTVVDVKGKKVIPTQEDFTTGLKNSKVELSPGDRITVSYNDDKNLRKDSPRLNAQLTSSFYNGEISFVNEVIQDAVGGRGQRQITYLPAKRCAVGDQVTVLLEDWDLDLTDKRDVVKVQVSTSSGEKTVLETLETGSPTGARRGSDPHAHAGRFIGILKIAEETGPNAIKVKVGDMITAKYLDSENVDPGIPLDRSVEIEEAGSGKPDIQVFGTSLEMVEDTGSLAKARIAKMRLSKEEKEKAKILKPQVVAKHPDYAPEGEEAPVARPEVTKASVNAPLLLQVALPSAALHTGSSIQLKVLADSEAAAAKEEGREPVALTLKAGIDALSSLANSKGYGVRVLSPQVYSADDLLLNGIFSAVVRLQLGAPGDEVNDLVTAAADNAFSTGSTRAGEPTRVPTMIVSGADKLTVSVMAGLEGAEKEVGSARVQLMSDARMELLDRSYAVENTQIYLGDRFYLRLTDPDRDTTDELDEITVKVGAKSGDVLDVTLRETVGHSGVFMGSVRPEFFENVANAKAPKTVDGKVVPGKLDLASGKDKTDTQLGVVFGEELTFTYSDETSVEADKPIDRVLNGKIHLGTDGAVTLFSKRFKDPEMAVKVRFLTAEAKFEMAKDLRKLKKTEKADEAISDGKRILEEAIRDYPNTKLASQGEFLLANLAEELEKYDEAITRFSNVLGTWPESEYAPRSQFHLAKCHEKKKDFDAACEEYVKLTYLYPDSDLVKDATIRLGDYYYKQKRYDIAAKIFSQFQARFPDHHLAAKSLFLSAQCFMQDKMYKEAIPILVKLIETYEDKDLLAEAMYWLGESYNKSGDMEKSYQTFKKLTWDYPASRWAKIARGRLTEEAYAKMDE